MTIVAFDLDGTLVDSVADIAAALNKALADHALAALPMPTVRGFVGRGARNLVVQALAHARADAALVDDVLERFRVRYEGDLANETRPFPGIVDALDALRATGLVLAVATNKPGAFARPLVDALLPGRFAVVLGPDDAGTLKPDPRVLRVVEERCGGRVACYVGDSAVDVDCARAADVPSIGVTWGLRPDEARQADVVVDDCAALSGAILRLLSSASTEHRRRR